MKRWVTPVLIASLAISINFPTANAAVKQGALCKKVGQVSSVSGIKYICTKSGSKLVWDKGVNASPSKPQSKPTSAAFSETDLSKFSPVDTCRLKTALTHPNHVGFPRTVTKIPSTGNHKAM